MPEQEVCDPVRKPSDNPQRDSLNRIAVKEKEFGTTCDSYPHEDVRKDIEKRVLKLETEKAVHMFCINHFGKYFSCIDR